MTFFKEYRKHVSFYKSLFEPFMQTRKEDNDTDKAIYSTSAAEKVAWGPWVAESLGGLFS